MPSELNSILSPLETAPKGYVDYCGNYSPPLYPLGQRNGRLTA